MILTCSVNIYAHYTSRLYKDADEVEQNDWTAWPDHSMKQGENMMRRHIGSVINLLIVLPPQIEQPRLSDCYIIRLAFPLKLMEMQTGRSHRTTS